MVRFLVSVIQAFALLVCVPVAAAPSEVGEVVFASGDAHIVSAGRSRPARTGDLVSQDDELVTRDNGYVYIKTMDQGFVSLRPNSAVHFEIYEYAADKPQASRFKTSLKYGVMRAVSGVGAQRARDKYRLNTPVAAIGIRGTDFTVYASPEITRATVTSGGIVMSAFNDSCTPGGTGPCNGSQVAELFAQQAGHVLQLRRGDAQPAVLDKDAADMRPDAIAPPLPGEKPGKSTTTGSNGTTDFAGREAIVVRQGVVLQETLEQAVSSPPPASSPSPPVQQVFWGRWLPLAGGATEHGSELASLRASGKTQLAFNSVFGLLRDRDTSMVLPSAGVYNFALQSHQSYIYDQARRELTAARIEDPMLSIDFNRQRFDTRFTVVSDTRQVNFTSRGSVQSDGAMASDMYGQVVGSLANGGQQAGFLYEQKINDQERAVGATYWSR